MNANVIVTNNAVTDYALLGNLKRAATWKEFSPVTAATIVYPLRGVQVRVRAEGECLLTDPKAVCLITDTVT